MKRYQLEKYRKFLLNRVTALPHIVEYIENCLSREDEAAKHSFHKIMVHNWSENDIQLFDILMEYFTSVFIPVNYTSQGGIATFHTCSLNLILKLIKLDFMFPYQRNMFNIDILFNDKTSADCFESRVTVEEIVSGVVSCRFNDKFELNLSNFCNDSELAQKKINFYKLSLLSHFKILMLRMGRDTKILNLSNNNLSQVPVEILNFFIKGDLIAINLSNNNIPSMSELLRVTSKIEKLWIEGNPLCEEMDAISYVKVILIKFPRLTELDGIKLNQHGVSFPFFKNYLETPDRRTKMLVEKFLTLYFAHYDTSPRKKIDMFYDIKAKLSITTNFTEAEEQSLVHYGRHSRNILDPNKRKFVVFNNKLYKSRNAIAGVFRDLPESAHDPYTFNVDVLVHDTKMLVLVVDGIYKEKSSDIHSPYNYFQFRRTFVFSIYVLNANSIYHITNEMFNISFASKEQIETSFKNPFRNMNHLTLINPDQDEKDTVCQAFCHLTQLKRLEVESHLKKHNWDIKTALKDFIEEMKSNKISPDKFIDDDDFSDTSSLLEDEID